MMTMTMMMMILQSSPLGLLRRHHVTAAVGVRLLEVLFVFLASLSLLLPFQCSLAFSDNASHRRRCRQHSAVAPLPAAASLFGGVQNQNQERRRTTTFWRNSAVCQNQQVLLLLATNRRNNDDNIIDDNNDGRVTLESLMEKQRRQSLIEALFNVKGSSKEEELLVQVHLQGKTSLTGSGNNKTISSWFGGQESGGDCLVLSTRPPTTTNTKQEEPPIIMPCLLIPLVNPSQQLPLVEAAYIGCPISNTKLWRLNMLAVNRDGALFDGIPWSTWTIDPLLRNRDAAGNVINAKFHFGKRDAYNVMMGKDWKGQSLAMANLAQQLRQKLLLVDESSPSSSSSSQRSTTDKEGEEDVSVLARRMLELEIKELEMDVAECDYQLAILNNNNPQDDDAFLSQETLVEQLEFKRQALVQDLQARRARCRQVTTMSNKQSSSSFMTQVLDRIQQDAGNSQNKAPYRGATGYDPYLDQNNNDNENNNSNEAPYTCPYDMLCEILENQLQAQVIGAVLENTSWLPGTIALGGALVLRRKTALEKVSIAGAGQEVIIISNDEQDYGNPGINGGETFLVECDADEAISLSLACSIPLQVESFLLERSSVMARPKQQQQQQNDDDDDSTNDNERTSKSRRRRPQGLPEWETVDPELSVLFEGQAGNMATTERVAPIRIPRTTMSLYDSLFEPKPSSSSSQQQQQQEMFPTDNPVQSLSAYDAMSNQDKAITLMTMSNFPREQRLPRPRAVRQSEQRQQQGNNGSTPQKNALDELLLPLIDESVRREYRLRDAQRRGDLDLVEQLQRETSRRQVAKAKAAQARVNAKYEQNDGVAEWWQSEADLYDSIKADVTQDDGSYSRFLDKDEDYERNRRRLAARVNKKKFGPLLDGMDLNY